VTSSSVGRISAGHWAYEKQRDQSRHRDGGPPDEQHPQRVDLLIGQKRLGL
jgi:hypothetical protein